MYNRTTSLDDFLTATAARQPTPGGGSVAALAGALSSAIGEMVLSYSIGKKDLIPFEAELKQGAHEFQQAREVLLRLMVEDQEAYAELTAVRKLPADSIDRAQRLPVVALACIRCPQAVGATAVAILKVCDQLIEIVNPWLLSDLAVCADLAMATARAAMYNVRVNLSSVENAGQRKQLETETDAMLSHAKVLIQHVGPLIWSRYETATRK
jgi:glutamate formiminotransferase/formiminotetrahydrofolate cyclodeaminase